MRNAKADLVDIPSIHVVEPDKALNFFELSSVEIMARVQDAYRQGDKVIEDARDYFYERSLFEACVIIDIAIDSIIDGITTIDSAELINGHLVCKYLDRYNVVPHSVYLNESICVSEVSEYVIEPDEIFSSKWQWMSSVILCMKSLNLNLPSAQLWQRLFGTSWFDIALILM